MTHRLLARHESWPLSRPFRISRGVKTAADVVVVEAFAHGHSGFGECVPYARYGEDVDSVLAQVAGLAPMFEAGRLSRSSLQALLPAGAARNAIDCALWDLAAKQERCTVADALGVPPAHVRTAVTISLDAPERMGEAAAAVADANLLKVKVDAATPLQAIAAVRAAAPHAQLIVDPNESWSVGQLKAWLPDLASLSVALLEQPVAAGEDAGLQGIEPPVAICADESAHTRHDLARVADRYQAVNIKLDKTGGLTEALAMAEAVRAHGLQLMVGCMVCTSLAIAPALLLAQGAEFVDLDGPWWLARDRAHAVRFVNGVLYPAHAGWGVP